MKILRMTVFTICVGMMAFLSQAQAAYFSVSPTGSFDAKLLNATTINYDVYLNVELADLTNSVLSLAGWDITFEYDNVELTNPTQTNVSPGIISSPGAGLLHSSFLSGDPSTDVSFDLGAHLLGSFAFDIAPPLHLFDGSADFAVLTQEGDLNSDMFLTSNYDILKLPAVLGADVGTAPVPIPGALWLLGSGLVGLVGLRRKRVPALKAS